MSLGRYLLYVAAGVVLVGVAGYVIVRLTTVGGVTSWWRSPWHNREVGGAPLSRHQVGLAYDVQATSQNRSALGALAALWPLAKIIDEGDHLHFQWV